MENMSKNIRHSAVFFLPEVGFYPYLRGLAVLGSALQQQGQSVFFTRCSGQLPHCSMLVGHQVPLSDADTERPRYCALCKRNFDAAQSYYGFEYIDFAALHVDLQKCHKAIAELSLDELLAFSFENFPLAKIAQYDFSLESKLVYSQEMDECYTKLYRAHVENTYIAALFAKEIAEKFKPSILCTFNQYAQCHLVRHVAKINDIAYQSLTYPVNFGIDASLYSLTGKEYCYWGFTQCQQWGKIKDMPSPAGKALGCWQDTVFRENAQGSHIYSAAKSGKAQSVFKHLDLSQERKLIVAYTSSYDELVGIEIAMDLWNEKLPKAQVFSNQIEWLQDLREWAASRNDVQVVVRVHPREGKNKNYSFSSQHLEALQADFATNTDSFKVVWPEDPISSYDLVELAHACVVPWTTMGMEAARVGVPVLSWVGNMYYADDDFIQVATDHSEYRKRLNALVSMDYTWFMLTKAVRYYHWRTFIPCLNLRETVPITFDDPSIWPLPPEDMKKDIVDILENRRDLIEYTKEKWLKELPDNALEMERAANLKGIRLYVDSLFNHKPQIAPRKQPFLLRAVRKALRLLSLPVPNVLAPLAPPAFAIPSCEDYSLEFYEGVRDMETYMAQTAADPSLRILAAEDEWYIWHVSKGQAVRRMSPLLIRLGRCMKQTMV